MTQVRILKCPSCGSYALVEACPCGATRIPPKPPKYSPDDKYAHYRRQYKEQHQGLQAGERSSSSTHKPATKPAERPMHPLEAKRRGLE